MKKIKILSLLSSFAIVLIIFVFINISKNAPKTQTIPVSYEKINHITIKSINISLPVYSKISRQHLVKGTICEKHNKNLVIFAHNFVYKDVLFTNLKHVKKGDTITLNHNDEYKVTQTFVSCNPCYLGNYNKPRLTIYTCTDAANSSKRFIVIAKPIK